MKHKFLPLGLLLVAGLTFTFWDANSQGNRKPGARTRAEKGVVINGVEWATSNVAEVGTFAAGPESAGMLYQWNRGTAWSDTSDISLWNANTPYGDTWDYENDPSPIGWRVPNFAEIETLLDTNMVRNEWTTLNGVEGRKFTDKATGNSIFLPVTGYRNHNHGVISSAQTHGYYWSSTQKGINAYGFRFSDAYVAGNDDFRGEGKAVRCVAE